MSTVIANMPYALLLGLVASARVAGLAGGFNGYPDESYCDGGEDDGCCNLDNEYPVHDFLL